ncbi:MAG TPA: hypothetical protein VMS21_14810 [Methylomirabilota bacterium]|nr:hypothetical protein [Methylomirabilota bacterium]
MRSIFCVLLLSLFQPALAQLPGNRPGYPGPIRPGWSRVAIDYDRQFTRLKSASQELKRMEGDEAYAGRVDSIHRDATFLQNRWRVWLQRNREIYVGPRGSDRYYKSLGQLNELLAQALETGDADQRRQLVEAVAMDLELKAESCRESADGLGKEVWVKVRTVAGGQEVRGYQIWFVPRGMLPVESAHDHFSRLSSPTDELILPPGAYMMWGLKDGEKTEPIPQRLGDKGRERVEIDLIVPGE